MSKEINFEKSSGNVFRDGYQITRARCHSERSDRRESRGTKSLLS